MTLNAGDIKRMNRHRIFELLVDYGRTTKTELAQRSGLSNPTVYNIVSAMEERGLIERVEDVLQPQTPGRPRQYLRLNGDSRYAFGVRYEGEILCVGLLNLCGSMRAVRVQRGVLDVEQLFCNVLPACMEEMLCSTGVDRARVAGVGIGLSLCAEPREEHIRELEARMGMRVLVGHDAHFAVAGEYVNRKQRVTDMLYVCMGTTVSCGVMVDGHVRKGSAGQLGRIGSMILEDGNTLDGLIGRSVMRQRFGTLPDFDSAAASAYAVKYLAAALHNLLLGCDVHTIVLGGDVAARLGAGAVEAVQEELLRLSSVPVSVLRQSCPTPAVLGAAFGVFYMALDEIIGTED